MFSYAIVRLPGRSVCEGLSSSSLGKPDYKKAMAQHEQYTGQLKAIGLDVRILPADENYPDSVFIEDTALCTPSCAVITNPGAVTRRGEINGMKGVLSEYYGIVEEIILPGTLEAGDVMMAGDTYFIGISSRTNHEGANQLIAILRKYGFTGIKIPLGKLLHLKSGVSYLENNYLLTVEEFDLHPEFEKFSRIVVVNEEKYAANSLWINGTVIVPEGYEETRKAIGEAGYHTLGLDVSEFRKADGGLSCLSLRF